MTDLTHFPLGDLDGTFPVEYHGRRIILDRPFAFRDAWQTVTVPLGFTSDFNSIPRALWSWFPPFEFPEAGVIHDYLYRTPGIRTRGECDRVHRRILELTGCRTSKRQAAYLGLRAGGWLTWRRYRKAEQAETV